MNDKPNSDEQPTGATVMWLVLIIGTVTVLGFFVFFLGALVGWW